MYGLEPGTSLGCHTISMAATVASGSHPAWSGCEWACLWGQPFLSARPRGSVPWEPVHCTREGPPRLLCGLVWILDLCCLFRAKPKYGHAEEALRDIFSDVPSPVLARDPLAQARCVESGSGRFVGQVERGRSYSVVLRPTQWSVSTWKFTIYK